MKLSLSRSALVLAFRIPFALLAVHPASAQTGAIQSSGTSGGGGGHLDITIETVGTFVGIRRLQHRDGTSPCDPYPADCHILTQAITTRSRT